MRATDGRRQRSRKIINEEREKDRVKNGSLWNTSTESKGAAFVILTNHASAPDRKESLRLRNKVRREAGRKKFMEKGGLLDKVESFREIDGSKDCARAPPGFVKPIRNRRRKKRFDLE